METILSIIALVISLISGGFTFYTFWWTNRRDRRQATLEAYNRLQTEVFDNLNSYTPTEIRDICTDVKSPEYKTISGYVARIEHFCEHRGRFSVLKPATPALNFRVGVSLICRNLLVLY